MVKYFFGGQEVRINGDRINKVMTTPWKINMEQQKWRFGSNDFSFSIGLFLGSFRRSCSGGVLSGK